MAIIDLTTLARVKLGLAKSDANDDTWLANQITATSRRIERFIDREIEITARTQEFDVSNVSQSSIWLRTFPNITITSIINATDWDFASTDPIDSDDYRVDEDNGEVHFRVGLAIGPKSVQVVYTAGLAADTDQVELDFPDLAMACDLQVAAAFRRRSSPQGGSSKAGGGEITHEGALKFIPDVREALLPLRRLRFGVN